VAYKSSVTPKLIHALESIYHVTYA